MKLLALIFVLFLSTHTDAETPVTYYAARPTLPMDFAAALNHVQLHTEGPIKLTQQIIFLDQLLEPLSEEERLFFAKTELYKALFRHARIESVRQELFELASLELAQAAFQESLSMKETHPYLHLLMGGLLTDLKDQMEDTNYRSFLQRLRSAPNQLQGHQLTTKRKLEMILPWLSWYQRGGLNLVNNKLQKALEEMLESCVSRLSDFHSLTRTERLQLNTSRAGNLLYFEVRPRPMMIAKPDEGPSTPTLEQTLAPLISEPAPIQPRTDDSWRPREDASQFFNMEPDPSYQPPPELPAPVNDWIDSL